MGQVIPSFRVLLKSTEIASLIEVLTYHRSQFGLPEEASAALAKLRVQAAKIDAGIKVADYIPTGTTRAKVSLESLGGLSNEENNHTGNTTTNTTVSATQSPRLPADLDADMEAELERLNSEMLASLGGNDNVILEERRKTPREPLPTGADLYAALTNE